MQNGSSKRQTSSDPFAVPESLQTQLDRRLFHLQTLHDMSRELLGTVEIKPILKNFLMMTLGNFGVIEGFILTRDTQSQAPIQRVSIGIQEAESSAFLNSAARLLDQGSEENRFISGETLHSLQFLPPAVVCVLVFSVDSTCSGILGLGPKIVDEPYSKEDRELLEILINNLVVSLKNARSAEALKQVCEELTILNKAKDKVINHLSHELKTPLALMSSSLMLLRRKLVPLPEESWRPTIERAERNLQRLTDLQSEVEDILRKSDDKSGQLICSLLDQCSDELQALVAEQVGEGPIVEKIRKRIEEIYSLREVAPEDILLDQFLEQKMKEIKGFFSHRRLDVIIDTEKTPTIRIPAEPLEKLIQGLIKNAIENTPDEGKIEIATRKRDQEVELRVHDYGVGIVEEDQQRIFEGFYPTQETKYYSSKQPFDFNAGGKGADLLRLKIFSERFNFRLDMSSQRCRYIPLSTDKCPGQISRCEFCRSPDDCHHSGGTIFKAVFPVQNANGKHRFV
jgi:signal transduction histidine kinase